MFFFDVHRTVILGVVVELPIGLLFFPLTFALSNIIQDKYGKIAANSITLLVFIGLLLSYIGDREDYWTAFKDMPIIMVATWFF